MKRFLPYLTILFLMFGFSSVQGQATINVTAGATDNTINGNCSLREAVESANTNTSVDACTAGQSGGTDVINIPDATYDLSTIGTDIHLSSDLTLNGTSQAGTIIQAHANAGTATDRIFLVDAVDIDVTIEDMTIEHGRFTSTGVNRRGAGIGIDSGGGASTGTVTLTRVTVDENETAAGGGGINVEDNLATITLTDCTISNNSAFNAGGFRQAGAATANVSGCIFIGNTAINKEGGGINMTFSSSNNTFTNCSFLNNTVPNNNADSDGGAAYIQNATSTTFISCTFSGNSTADNGGAISNRTTGTGLYNCTIVNNSTTVGDGGGLFTGQAMTITNTIIANNTAAGDGNDVESNATITQTTSLAEDCAGSSCPTWSYTSDPNLAAAATCGSPAQTYFEPQSPSDAINNGTAPGGNIPATDICGTAVTSVKDIGSRETSVVLPVELINFQVQNSERQSYLTWQTVSEINNEGFEIEWSVDNRNWENIGFTAGAGDSFEKQSYEFIHNRPVSGINYYRLKQMDFDGVFEYSNTVSVDFPTQKPENLKLFPNPTETGTFTVALPTSDFESAELNLFDLTGQLIHTQPLNNSQTEIRIFNLPKGIYTATVNLDGRLLFERVTVQ